LKPISTALVTTHMNREQVYSAYRSSQRDHARRLVRYMSSPVRLSSVCL